jgi:hypothetical protein
MSTTLRRALVGAWSVAVAGVPVFAALAVTGTVGGAAAASANEQGPCRDRRINRALREVTGRLPSGSGDSGECAPGNYGKGQWSSYEDLQNKITVRMTRKGVAYVFVAPKMAILQGHIGWGYMLDDGTYAFGATDAPGGNAVIARGRDTNTPWRATDATEREMLGAFKRHDSPSDIYREYKRTFVMQRNAGAAEFKSNEIRSWGYSLYRNNCLDHAYAVLEAYGVDKSSVMSWKETRPAPDSWFRAFKHMNLGGQVSGGDDWPEGPLQPISRRPCACATPRGCMVGTPGREGCRAERVRMTRSGAVMFVARPGILPCVGCRISTA